MNLTSNFNTFSVIWIMMIMIQSNEQTNEYDHRAIIYSNTCANHKDELVSLTFGMGVLWLCHSDEMLSPTFNIATDLMWYEIISKPYIWDTCAVATSYGWDVKSFVSDNNSCLPYGGLAKSSVEDGYAIAMSYGWDAESYVWDGNTPYVIRTSF